MTTREIGDITLRKIRDYVWEIPQEGGMNTPARVLASESLLEEIAEDKTLEQLQNSTHLPGITNPAICMPDGHQGYGFPVGGVGAVDAETGCISPGAVGYDINCLPGSTDVRLSFGRRRPLEHLRDRFEDEQATVATGEGLTSSDIQLFTESGEQSVYEIETAGGATVEATADHRFQTPDGLVEVSTLQPGDQILTCPFRGIDDTGCDGEFAGDGVDNSGSRPVALITADDFTGAQSSLRQLQDRGLIPLHSTDTAANRLLKLLGYHAAEGTQGDDEVRFHGRREALQQIREDLQELGFDSSPVHERSNRDAVGSNPADECVVTVESKPFCDLFAELTASGSPHRGEHPRVPPYLEWLADWQRALFYSAYFGAAMTPPQAGTVAGVAAPDITLTGREKTAPQRRAFLEQAADFLADLSVDATAIESRSDNASDRATTEQRLQIHADPETLVTFFETIGYRYAPTKRRTAMAAICYLNRQSSAPDRMAAVPGDAKARADGGHTAVGDSSTAGGVATRTSQAGDGPVAGHQASQTHRDQTAVEPFEAFCERIQVSADLSVPVRVTQIEPAGEKPVFDIGVSHEAHTFLADGFVVSNCGVRMMRTNLTYDDVRGNEEELVDELFEAIPTGLGGGGVVQPGIDAVEGALERGVEWAVENGFGVEDDLRHCEDEGRRTDAQPEFITQKSKDRGKNQMGSLGSGNHFLEVQRVTDIFDETVADPFGLESDQIVVLIHCGSRGLGHQTCTDYLRRIEEEHSELLERLPDKELAAAPAGSRLADEYYGAMCAAINFAWVNRQLIMHQTRQVFEQVFDRAWQDMDMDLLYDVAHNIAKKETHEIDGDQRELYVHRKGATRAFPAGRAEIPAAYRDVGQPVIIPGSMGAGSYILRGGAESMDATFGSTAHGAGRLMSRTQAKREYWGGDVQDDLRDAQKVYVKAESGATIAEEAPGVYKDIDEVVRVSDALGIGDKVARTFPVCNIKG